MVYVIPSSADLLFYYWCGRKLRQKTRDDIDAKIMAYVKMRPKKARERWVMDCRKKW